MTYHLPRLLRAKPVLRRQPADPLDHPVLANLSPRQIADLPRPKAP